jgi:hypothetical protein
MLAAAVGKRRGGGIETLGALLGRTSSVRPTRAEAVLAIPPRAWERAVGSRIAARARPTRLERGVLQVVAASAAWSQELSLLAESIAARLREEGLAVTTLRFTVGEVEPPARVIPREPPRELPPPAPLPRDLRGMLDRIEDAELRDAIAGAAATSLAWELDRAKRAGGQASQPPPSPRRRARKP